eukprot:1185590-Prorocentrum_minimum.AAC.1
MPVMHLQRVHQSLELSIPNALARLSDIELHEHRLSIIIGEVWHTCFTGAFPRCAEPLWRGIRCIVSLPATLVARAIPRFDMVRARCRARRGDWKHSSVVEQRDKLRLIHDLSYVNGHLDTPKFRYENLQDVSQLLV